MKSWTRRDFLGAGATVAAGAGLLGVAGCGGGSGGSDGANIQFAWWGNPDRDKRTKAAIKVYGKQHPDVTIRPQITGWDGYWDKLATQTAGGAPPDLIQMDYAYITSYSDRGALLALDDYVPKQLHIDDFGKTALDPGRVNGKLYGVNLGINSWGMMCNRGVLKDAGQDLPGDSMTWDEFADLVRTVAKKTPKGVYGTQNGMLDSSNNPLECWLRERGKELYSKDQKKPGFDQSDLVEWFEFWEGLVKDGAAAKPEVQLALSGDLADGLVPTHKAAFQFAWSNQLTAFAEATKDDVNIHMYPQGNGSDAKPGQYLKASMLLSISAETKAPDATVALANALLTEPKVAGKLGFERGYPPSPEVRKELLPKATPPEKASAKYIDSIKSKVGPTPPPPPQATEKVRQAMTYSFQQAAYGKMSNEKAAAKFFHDAEKALA